MNNNSFWAVPHLLPVTVKRDQQQIYYSLNGMKATEDDYIAFIENELPGVIVGDNINDDHDGEYVSIFRVGDEFTFYRGNYHEGEEADDGSITTTVWIEKIKTVTGVLDCYLEWFTHRKSIDLDEVKALNLPSPEMLFWSYFADNGYSREEKIDEMDGEGYVNTAFVFTKNNQQHVVTYPQRDYQEDSLDFDDWQVTSDGYVTNWSAFIRGLKQGKVVDYGYFRY